jgi:hypothetical protein
VFDFLRLKNYLHRSAINTSFSFDTEIQAEVNVAEGGGEQ